MLTPLDVAERPSPLAYYGRQGRGNRVCISAGWYKPSHGRIVLTGQAVPGHVVVRDGDRRIECIQWMGFESESIRTQVKLARPFQAASMIADKDLREECRIAECPKDALA